MDIASGSPYGPTVRVRAPRNPNGHTSPHAQKSKEANGVMLPGFGRSAWVRRCRDVIAAYRSDFPDATTAEQSLIRRAAALTTELEAIERKFAMANIAGEPSTDTDLDNYQRLTNTLRRCLEVLAGGLARRPRDIGLINGQPEVFSPLRAQLERERAQREQSAQVIDAEVAS
jgi:citrate lyase beta subunit